VGKRNLRRVDQTPGNKTEKGDEKKQNPNVLLIDKVAAELATLRAKINSDDSDSDSDDDWDGVAGRNSKKKRKKQEENNSK
jgi:hypothetical protein